MGNFDAAAVIQAAATSNLGVISLIVLVLAFLAWRFFQRSDDKVKLIAFAMMFLGAAGFVAAVMLAGGDTKRDSAPAEPARASASGAAATAATPPAEDSSIPDGVADIAGTWHDSDGYTYAIRQDGATFSYTFAMDGAQIGRGAGTITGSRLNYTFANDDGSSEGSCEGQVANEGRMIRGTCRDGPDSWAFAIER